MATPAVQTTRRATSISTDFMNGTISKKPQTGYNITLNG